MPSLRESVLGRCKGCCTTYTDGLPSYPFCNGRLQGSRPDKLALELLLLLELLLGGSLSPSGCLWH